MISVLFLAADPTDASRMRLGEEAREIQEKLQLARLRDFFTFHSRFSVRPEDISQALLDTNPQIVHFSGHGIPTGAICVEDKSGKTQPISPSALAALFKQFAGQVKCVILNACYSESQAQAIGEHIDYVIGMRQSAEEKAAIAFSVGFYQALGAGLSIEDAYKLGCVQIRLRSIPEHLAPVLIKKRKEKTGVTAKQLDYAPNNLPSRREFIGRVAEKEQVIEGLLSRWPIISIEGMGGVGKTTLAIEIGFDCLPGGDANLEEPFEACVFVSAKDRKIFLNDLLDTIARVLNRHLILQEIVLRDKAEQVNQLLRNQKVLIIVDNFETVTDEELIHYLECIPEPSKVLITSRYRQLRRVWDVPLKGLSRDKSLELIRLHARRLHLDTLAKASDEELLPLVDVTGGNPYAIETSLGFLKYGGMAFNTLVNALYEVRHDVEQIFDYIFGKAWSVLGRDARRVLLIMPFFIESAAKDALGAVAGLDSYYLNRAITQLVEMSLLDVSDAIEESQRRYSIHPLTLAFAVSRSRKERDFIREAQKRWITWYVNLLQPQAKRGVQYLLLEKEVNTCLAVIDWCLHNGPRETAVSLYEHLSAFLIDKVHWSKAIEYAHKISDVCKELGDPARGARIMSANVGYILLLQGELDAVEKIGEESLRLLLEHPDLETQAIIYRLLGLIARDRGELGESERLLNMAIHKFKEAGNAEWERIAKGNLSGVLRRLRKFDEAEAILQEELQKSKQDRLKKSMVLCRLGTLYLDRGEATEAIKFYERSLAIDRELGRKISIGYNLWKIARAEKALCNYEQAKGYASEAYEVFGSLHLKKEMEQVRAFLKELSDE